MNLSAFRSPASKDPVKPARVLLLQPEDFCDTWRDRPKYAIAIGLRRLSENDEQSAIKEAQQDATRAAPEVKDQALMGPGSIYQERWIEAFNEALMRIGVARAVCDPNDALRAHESFPVVEDTIGMALRRGTIRRLWDALEEVVALTSPLYPVPTDEQLEGLAWAILGGAVGELDGAARNRALRLSAALLELLEAENLQPLPDEPVR